jgi:hypothetical protein
MVSAFVTLTGIDGEQAFPGGMNGAPSFILHVITGHAIWTKACQVFPWRQGGRGRRLGRGWQAREKLGSDIEEYSLFYNQIERFFFLRPWIV